MNDEKLPLGSPAAKYSTAEGKSPVIVNTATVVGRAPLNSKYHENEAEEPRGAEQ